MQKGKEDAPAESWGSEYFLNSLWIQGTAEPNLSLRLGQLFMSTRRNIKRKEDPPTELQDSEWASLLTKLLMEPGCS